MSGPFQRLQGIPPIKALMTPFPHSIAADATVEEARHMMELHSIRHLPVKEGEALIGVVTDREVERALDPAHSESPDSIREIFIPAHFEDLMTPANRVLERMARERIEAVLVLKDDRLAGIFTVTDACARFSELLRTLFPGGGGAVA